MINLHKNCPNRQVRQHVRPISDDVSGMKGIQKSSTFGRNFPQANFALKNFTKIRQNRHFRQADCALTNLTKICQNRQLHSARDAA